MFLFKSLSLTALLYAVFLVLSAMGYVRWKRSLAAAPAPDSAGVAQGKIRALRQ
jgi:hypothetical protein